jgi:hypothetical protein
MPAGPWLGNRPGENAVFLIAGGYLEMKKMLFWGFAVFMPLVMFGACRELPPANSIWKYDGKTDDIITLEVGSLTYNSIRAKRLKTLAMTMTSSPSEKIQKETEKSVSLDERILTWIISSEDASKIYGIIYCSIKKDQNDKVTTDIPPEKLKLLEPGLFADLNISYPYIYIRQ